MGNDKKERSTGVGVQIDAPTPTPDKMIRQQDGVTSLKLPHPLTLEEKKYLLAVERGDLGNVRRILQKAHRKQHININCMDPLGRRALTLAIDGENLEMVELLIVMGVETKDALLQAINAEFVEAVELLLEHEELIHNEGEPYSWQKVDINTAMFTPDITPLILAAHRNNFEILKILLDRGAAVPIPHDIKCGCEECIRLSTEDSLRHSLSRVNVYRALASPSLIALTSSDPLLTAFQLSWELRNLAFTEQECKAEYLELRRQCQKFAVDLLDQTRNSQELAIVLNYDPSSPPYVDGDRMTLARLELAIKYKQKKFVAHPNIQQLLAAMWYEGVPGFRRKTNMEKLFTIIQVAVLFPFYCLTYMLMPGWGISRLMRKPFMKFLIHASSYLFFLFILILVSQRAEDNVIQMFGTENMKRILKERMQKQRGNGPTGLELIVVLYVLGFIWEEVQEIYTVGIKKYLRNMWNFIDFTRNGLYISVCCLRIFAYIQQQNEINKDPSTAYIPREQWHDFDPQLIAEGLFAAANIFSALKLVHLFSINPHLGPLQISLGRMVIDIVKFFFIYSLVLFSFACGLNQLLWYFADLEKQKCYILPGNQADWANNGDSCMKWRRFGNLFESSQSLFWASFGMVGLDAFELTGIKSYTRFWGLLMFGSYSVINVIVLLNLLIAMMSNSYAMIDEHSDTEWKFARTKLWMSYFEDSATLPSPFNILPSMKWIIRIFRRSRKEQRKRMSMKKQEAERENRYINIMRALVWRYVSSQHRKYEEQPVTEDDIYEVKGEISSMRYEMLEIFGRNGMDVSSAAKKEKPARAKRNKTWERRLMKDFQVTPVPQTSETGVGTNNADDDDKGDPDQITSISTGPPPINEDPKSKFRRIARQIANDSVTHKWNEVLRGVSKNSQIGRCNNKQSYENQQNLQKAIEEAKRLILMSPPPRSSTMSPVEFVDDTSETLLELLNKISEEVSSKCKSTPSQFLSNNNNNNSKNKNNNANIIKPIPTKPSVSTSTATIATITSTASTKTENDTINNNSNDSNISKSCISNEARPISPPPMFSNKPTNLAASSSSSSTTTTSKQQLSSKGNDTTGRQTTTSTLSETPIIKITSIDSNNQTVQSATTHLPTIKPPPPGKPTKKAPPPPPSIPLHERQSFVNNRPPSAIGVGGSTTNISSLQASQTATAAASSSSSYLRRSPTISLRKCDSVPETFDPPITFLSLNDSTEELVPRSYSPDSDTSTLPPTSPRLKERMPDISMVKRKAGWL